MGRLTIVVSTIHNWVLLFIVAFIIASASFFASNTLFDFLTRPGPITIEHNFHEPITRDDNIFSARVYGIKQRPECSPIASSISGYTRSGHTLAPWIPTNFSINDMSEVGRTGLSRPYGLQDFGVWTWNIFPSSTHVIVTLSYICDGEGQIQHTIGPFLIPEK